MRASFQAVLSIKGSIPTVTLSDYGDNHHRTTLNFELCHVFNQLQGAIIRFAYFTVSYSNFKLWNHPLNPPAILYFLIRITVLYADIIGTH